MRIDDWVPDIYESEEPYVTLYAPPRVSKISLVNKKSDTSVLLMRIVALLSSSPPTFCLEIITSVPETGVGVTVFLDS